MDDYFLLLKEKYEGQVIYLDAQEVSNHLYAADGHYLTCVRAFNANGKRVAIQA
jgi:hypothetical protein